MHQKDQLQLKFFQSLKPGMLIDVLNTDQDWKLAKVIDRDKRYLLVEYDGWPSKEQQFYFSSYRIAPLRTYTIGYTGSLNKVSRHYLLLKELANYLEIGHVKLQKLKDTDPFEFTQIFRGQIFVHMHNLIYSDWSAVEKQVTLANQLLQKFVGLCLKVLDLAIQYKDAYFGTSGWGGKLFHFYNPQVTLVCSLQELLYLLQFLVRAEECKQNNIFKGYNKGLVSQEQLWAYFQDKKGIIKLQELFKSTDGNGKWYPTQTRKYIFKILLKAITSSKQFLTRLKLPVYSIKDYAEFYSIYPFMFAKMPDARLENQYIDYSIQVLLRNAPFDAKLRAIQELRKSVENKVPFQYVNKSKIMAKILEKKILQALLEQKRFNPEVFKRFVPLLSSLCKVKPLSLIHIKALFDILQQRHDSETQTIFEIIGQVTDFAPSSLLDTIFQQICKLDLNDQQTLQFLKTFTIKAVENLNRQKSYLANWFGKRKNSSRYGHFGLNLLLKESADDGSISPQYLLQSLKIIKQILEKDIFQEQKWPFISSSLQSIKKRKNLGQSIKLISLILSTYQESNFLGENREKVVKKLDSKYSLLGLIIQAFKEKSRITYFKDRQISHSKFSKQQCFKFFFELVETMGNYINNPLRIKQIEYLWLEGFAPYLLEYLSKDRQDTIREEKPGYRVKKIVSIDTVESIFKDILTKDSFYKRQLCFQQFQTVYELFLYYHIEKENILLKTKDGLVRYRTTDLMGYSFFLRFVRYAKQQPWLEKVFQKVCNILLRPLDQPNREAGYRERAVVWKNTFSTFISQLVEHPWKLLKFVEVFHSAIKGRYYKEITASNTTLQFKVAWGQQKKVIAISPRATIFHLRHILKERFKIKEDFDIYNVKLKKIVTFDEEQDFSVNAMPIMESTKSVSLTLSSRKGLHQHDNTILHFKALIEQDEKIYSNLFGLLLNRKMDETMEDYFWEIIELLPLNKAMRVQIAECRYYTIAHWTEYVHVTSEHSLLYKLNIILSLIRDYEGWALVFLETQGLDSLLELFSEKLEYWGLTFQNESLSLKILEVMLRVYQKCKNQIKPSKILLNLNEKLLYTLENQLLTYQQQHEQVEQMKGGTFCLPLLNKVLEVYLTVLKVTEKKKDLPRLSLGSFKGIVLFGLFEPRSEDSRKFCEEILISLTFTAFEEFKFRSQILNFLTNKLEISYLSQKKRCQQFFKYLTTILYSFETEFSHSETFKKQNTDNSDQKQNVQVVEQQKTNQEEVVKQVQNFPTNNGEIKVYIARIWKFIHKVLQNSSIRDEENRPSQILHGSLSLLRFLVFHEDQLGKVDSQFLVNAFINNFLFPSNPRYFKRILADKSLKSLYQILKKIAFNNNQVPVSIIKKLKPFLKRSTYRKNDDLSWRLRFEKTQKSYFVGLQNLGATCYINCLFQQLFMIKAFRQKFMTIKCQSLLFSEQHQEAYELQKIFYELQYSDKKAVSTQDFCRAFITFEGQPINPVVQSDADEFLNSLLDKIQIFLRKAGHHEILERTFQGKLSNQLNCEGCPHSSEKSESFLSIGVSIKNKKTLHQALKGYVEGEILDGDNAYYCEPCDKKVRTLKRMCLKELPNILVIVLKRFQYDFDDYRKLKINSRLQFPQSLDITPYTSDYLVTNENISKETDTAPSRENIFHLRGTVIHAGNAQAGHYYSFIKEGQQWYEFNDDSVCKIAFTKIQEEGFGGEEKSSEEIKIQKYKNAYILFYEREVPLQSYLFQPPSQTKQNLNLLQRKNGIPSDNFNQVSDSQNHKKFQNETTISNNLGKQINQDQQKIRALKENQKQLIQNYKSREEDFCDQMKKRVLANNLEANIFSTILEPNFVHLWENFSILDSPAVKKFLLLYFHTAILRSHFRYQYAPSYFRIVSKIISEDFERHDKGRMTYGEWLISQINSAYIKQFLIEAPKTVRYLCTSLVIMALRQCINIDQQLVLSFVSMLRMNGMTPYVQILKMLSRRKNQLGTLRSINFDQILLSVINQQQERLKSQLPQPLYEVRSYFGVQVSQKAVEKEKCSAALIQALENFEVDLETLKALNSSFSYHKSNRVVNFKISKILLECIANKQRTVGDLEDYLQKCSEKPDAKLTMFKHYNEKYAYLIRGLLKQIENEIIEDQGVKKEVLQAIIMSLTIFIESYSDLLEPNQFILNEITLAAKNYLLFRKQWVQNFLKTHKLNATIKHWMDQMEKGRLPSISEQHMVKLKNLNVSEKFQLYRKKREALEKKIAWMTSIDSLPTEEFFTYSDIEEVKANQVLAHRNKAFRVRQKFEGSLICTGTLLEKADQQYWLIFDKSEIQIFSNL